MRTLIRLVGQIGQIIVAAAAIGLLAPAHAAPVVFSGSGLDATNAFDSFNAAIGADPRRIGWDGVRLDGTDANPATRIIDLGKTVEIPVDRFRAAGAIFADPYSVSGDGFASVNPGTAGQFPAFSPNNTFVMLTRRTVSLTTGSSSRASSWQVPTRRPGRADSVRSSSTSNDSEAAASNTSDGVQKARK
jgi:hypothetical protein